MIFKIKDNPSVKTTIIIKAKSNIYIFNAKEILVVIRSSSDKDIPQIRSKLKWNVSQKQASEPPK